MATAIEESTRVVLLRDIPEKGLRSGDIGTVVEVYEGGKGYEVEFLSTSGEWLAWATLAANDTRTVLA